MECLTTRDEVRPDLPYGPNEAIGRIETPKGERIEAVKLQCELQP